MTSLDAAILGAVQGLTEFLPVSSSGHLVIVKSLLSEQTQGVLWEVALHIGTLVALLWFTRKDVIKLIGGFFTGLRVSASKGFGAAWKENENFRMCWYVVIGTIPAAAIGVAFNDKVEALFQNPIATAVMLFFTGEILWLSKSHSLVPTGREVKAVDSFWIGIAQAVAIIPGISRSGSTISIGLVRDIRREQAARFSFLLSIPVILGAGVLEAHKVAKNFSAIPHSEWKEIALGMAVSAVAGYIALRLVLRLVKDGKIHFFAWYCWAASILSVAYFWRIGALKG